MIAGAFKHIHADIVPTLCPAVGVFFAYICSRISVLVPEGPREAFLEVTLKVGFAGVFPLSKTAAW